MSLYAMGYAVWRAGRNLGLIVRNEPAGRGLPLAVTYLRLLAEYIILVRLLRRPIRSARVLGYTVHFFDYAVFLFLFEELFLWVPYRFEAARPAPRILDCGSNIGMSILYFKRQYPEAVIVGFEPDKPTFDLLSRNVAANRLTHVTLHNRAVLEQAGPFDLYYRPQAPGFLGMAAGPRPGLESRTTAEAVQLSEAIDGEVDFLKLDIEGAEAGVLDEVARRGKLRQIREMVLEYHHHMQGDDDRLSALLALFEREGFGYDISALALPPFQRRREQGMLIYAYRKDPA